MCPAFRFEVFVTIEGFFVFLCLYQFVPLGWREYLMK